MCWQLVVQIYFSLLKTALQSGDRRFITISEILPFHIVLEADHVTRRYTVKAGTVCFDEPSNSYNKHSRKVCMPATRIDIWSMV